MMKMTAIALTVTKVRVAMSKLRRMSITISEFAKGVFIRARRFTRDCTVSSLFIANDLLLATKHIIVAEVVMAYIAILESFHEVANAVILVQA